AILASLFPGIVKEASGIPEPILAAAELALGLSGQFLMNLSPEWNDAAVGITEGGHAPPTVAHVQPCSGSGCASSRSPWATATPPARWSRGCRVAWGV